MLKKFKNIKISTLIINIVVSLAYPIIKTVISESNKLLIFVDTTTIISFLLMVFGVFYRLYQKGDFDRTAYIANRSLAKLKKTESAFLDDREKEREESFNYPLFLGIVYCIFCIVVNARFF